MVGQQESGSGVMWSHAPAAEQKWGSEAYGARLPRSGLPHPNAP